MSSVDRFNIESLAVIAFMVESKKLKIGIFYIRVLRGYVVLVFYSHGTGLFFLFRDIQDSTRKTLLSALGYTSGHTATWGLRFTSSRNPFCSIELACQDISLQIAPKF